MRFKDYAQLILDDKSNALAIKTARDIQSRFYRYVYPVMGNTNINTLRAKDIMRCVKSVETRCPASARRILNKLIMIFDHAVIDEHCDSNVARPVLITLNSYKEKGHAMLNIDQLPGFYRRIDNVKVSTAIIEAFWLIQYTALRRSECAKATWEEFDFENNLWVVPGERMKNGKDHVVPLASQVVTRLQRWQQQRKHIQSDTEWVFPSSREQDTHITPISLWNIIRAAGYNKQMTIHGARKVFSTLAHESGQFSIDAIELQLAHKIPGVRGVYNKAHYLPERTALMQWFADELDKLRGVR